MYTTNTPVSSVVYQVHILRYRICIRSGTAVYNQHTSDGGRATGQAMYGYRNTAYAPGAALILLWLSALYVDFLITPD